MGIVLCWFLWKMGPPKWQLFQHKIKKNMLFRGVRNRSRICSDLGTILKEIPSPWNHENIEKTLCFPMFFENRPSYYRPHFGLILASQNLQFWRRKSTKNRPRSLPRGFPKMGQFFIIIYVDLCWILASKMTSKINIKMHRKWVHFWTLFGTSFSS